MEVASVPVIVYGPMPCLPRTEHWVRLANEPRVTFAAAVDSKTGDNALTGEYTPRIDIRVNETTDTIGNRRRNEKFKTCPSLNFGIDIMTQQVLVGQKKLM